MTYWFMFCVIVLLAIMIYIDNKTLDKALAMYEKEAVENSRLRLKIAVMMAEDDSYE